MKKNKVLKVLHSEIQQVSFYPYGFPIRLFAKTNQQHSSLAMPNWGMLGYRRFYTLNISWQAPIATFWVAEANVVTLH